jgi:hypothetical protein
MDDQNHISLLRLQSAELTGRTPFCPENQVIAEYFDAELPQTEIRDRDWISDVCYSVEFPL